MTPIDLTFGLHPKIVCYHRFFEACRPKGVLHAFGHAFGCTGPRAVLFAWSLTSSSAGFVPSQLWTPRGAVRLGTWPREAPKGRYTGVVCPTSPMCRVTKKTTLPVGRSVEDLQEKHHSIEFY